MSNFIPVIIPPYPDELLYSWAQRLSKANGLSMRNFMETYFDMELYQGETPVDITEGFCHFFDSLNINQDIVEFYLSLSTFAFNSIFTTKREQIKIVNALFSLKNEFNISPVPRKKRYNLCQECMKEDLEIYGETYLHRAHQLHGVRICHKHHTVLQQCELSVREKDFMPYHKRYLEKIEVNNLQAAVAYTDYVYQIFKSGVYSNKEHLSDIIFKKIKKSYSGRSLIKNFVYDFNKQSSIRISNGSLYSLHILSMDKTIILTQYLFPDVKELVDELRIIEPLIKLYHCPDCEKDYYSTQQAQKDGWCCPTCMSKLNKNETYKKMVELISDGEYEMIGMFENFDQPINLLHKMCGNIVAIKPKIFLFQGACCNKCKSKKLRITNKKSVSQTETTWEEMFALCLQYKEEFGHLKFGKKEKYKGKYMLGWWNYQQRKIIKGTLSQEQIDRLASIGLIRKSYESKWYLKFEAYKKYVETTGSFKIMRRKICENQKIGSWAYGQKKRYKEGKLEQWKIDKLLKVNPYFFD